MAEQVNEEHALQLAMFMQRRDAMQFGVVKDGGVTPSWEDTGLAQQEYIADAEVTLRAVGVLGYGPIAEVRAERDAALAVIEQVREQNTLLNGRPRYREIDEIVSQSPASALTKVKDDAWDEGHEQGFDSGFYAHEDELTETVEPQSKAKNPYREKEADRG